MRRILALLRTSVGRKILMAVTGLGMLGFLLVHMIGNLYVLQGREALNAYAAWLKANPLLWPARLGLLLVFSLHVWLGLALARENRAARPHRYRRGLAHPLSSASSRSMVLTGLVVLAFVIFHLAHFTFGAIAPEAHAMIDAQGRHDVYGMVVASFANPWIAGTYAVAMLLLGVHLVHAGQSFLQTLGFHDVYGSRLAKNAGLAVVAVIIAGNLILPTAVFLGKAGEVDAAQLVSRAAAGAETPSTTEAQSLMEGLEP